MFQSSDRCPLVFRRVVTYIALAGLLAAGCAPTAAPGTTGTPAATQAVGEPIKIGLMVGITGSAPVQASSMRFAAEIAVGEANANGGVLTGTTRHPVELAIEDDKCTPQEGAPAIDRLLSIHKVNFLVGMLCSTATLAALPATGRAGLPTLVVSANSSAIATQIAKNEWKHIFQFSPLQRQLSRFDAEFIMATVKPKTVAILSDDNDPGRDHDAAIRQFLTQNAPSVQILGSTDFVKVDSGEMLAELTRIKARKPDVLFVFSTGANSDAYARQSAEIGLQTILMSEQTDYSRPETVQKYAKELEGAFVNIRWDPRFVTPSTPAFLEKFQAKANRSADNFALQQYDAMYVMFDAITRAGTLDSAKVVAALETTNLLGAWGTHTFGPLSEGHPGRWQFVIAQIESGKKVVVYPTAAAERPVRLPTWFKP